MPSSSSVNLNRLAAFAAVVEAGSFTAAADKLGLTKAMMSQHVSRLETELGVTLLARTTRRVTPTEAGTSFYADCARALQEMDAAIARVGGDADLPAGVLRLTASEDYGAEVVVPALAAFMEKHPAVRVDLVATDQIVDLVAGRFDLAIRTGWVREQGLRATRLGSFEQIVVAAPAYLKKHGVPKRPEDLAAHRWIALSILRAPLTLTFTAKNGKAQSVRVSAAVSTNATASLRGFLLQGAGISVLPDYMIGADAKAGRLVPLLPGWQLPTAGVHAVYPNVRYTSAKVRAFVDFFRERAKVTGDGKARAQSGNE
jgi:DNA-binding transcriptional LysR family regulator